MLADFLKTGKVQPQFAAIGKYFKNICYLNETRKTVTEIYCNEFVKNKTHYKVNFKYNGKMEQYKVAIGMPILVRRNMKQENLFNMMEFPIDEIENHDTSFKVNDIWFNLNDFRKKFSPRILLYSIQISRCRYQ